MFDIISGGLSAISGIAGIFGGSSEADKAASLAKKQAQFNYQSQLQNWAFQTNDLQNQLAFARAKGKHELVMAKAVAKQEWKFNNALAKFNYVKDKTNAELDWQYRTATQKMDWELQKTIQAAEYRAQMRAYEQSEITYAAQMDLNIKAANRAYEGEQIKLVSQKEQMALEAGGLMREGQKQQGAIAASGRQGASINRMMTDVEQTYARDIGILGMNLAYAVTGAKVGMHDGWLAAQSANQEAESNRMLKPMDMIDIPKPIAIPKAVIPKPLRIPKPPITRARPILPKQVLLPPRPQLGPVPTSGGVSGLSMLGGIGSSVLSGINTWNSLRPPQ